jgi:hypothetical protein
VLAEALFGSRSLCRRPKCSTQAYTPLHQIVPMHSHDCRARPFFSCSRRQAHTHGRHPQQQFRTALVAGGAGLAKVRDQIGGRPQGDVDGGGGGGHHVQPRDAAHQHTLSSTKC